MRFTTEQRLDIGRRIYDGELTNRQAAEKFGISICSAKNYSRFYREMNHLPRKQELSESNRIRAKVSKASVKTAPATLQDYQDMTKEELIGALIQARITEARLKKGYEVKGDGSVVRYSSKNTK